MNQLKNDHISIIITLGKKENTISASEAPFVPHSQLLPPSSHKASFS